MKIAIGNDHRGCQLKQTLLDFLRILGHEVTDMGFYDEQPSDHPIAAFKVGKAVVSGECDRGIVICGSGVGVTIAVNKIKGLYAFAPTSELQARWSREHNDTNVIAFGAHFIGFELAKAILKVWLETDADNDERFIRRRKQISDYENNELKL